MPGSPSDADLSWLLEDAKDLYHRGRKHGAILLLACAVDALVSRRDPGNQKDRKKRFIAFLKEKTRRPGRPQIHNVGVPKLGRAIEFEELIYTYLRCPLVHEGEKLKPGDSTLLVCLDWETIPWGLKCDDTSNVVILGGEWAAEVLADAVIHELEAIRASEG